MVEAVDQETNDASYVTNANAISSQRRTTGPNRRSTKGCWTEEEDQILVSAVKKYDNKHWRKIAECLPHKTDVQCLHRWQKVLNPDLVKGPWKKEEDDLIIELVGKQGKKKWSEIARHLPGRIGKQCRERWHNHLDPNIKRTPWTKEEELILINAHAIFGNKWAEISKSLEGRTENSIKNHWNCSIRKKLESYLARDQLDGCPKQAKIMDLDGSARTSLDLAIGPATTREAQLPASDGRNCKFRVKESKFRVRDSSSPDPDTSCQTNIIECKKRDDSKTIQCANYLSFNTHENLTSFQNSSEPSKPVDSLNSTTLSLPLTLSLNTSSAPNCNCENKRDQLHHKHKDDRSPTNLEELGHSLLSYESLQLKDLKTFGSFPSTDSYMEAAVTPVSYSTPAIHPDYSDPESIWRSSLRRAASSFKHTPSIIRKRSSNSKTSSQSSTDICSLKECVDNNSCSSSPFNRDDDNTINLSNEKQLLLSPPMSQKLDASVATKSIEKRLELAFNAEWD